MLLVGASCTYGMSVVKGHHEGLLDQSNKGPCLLKSSPEQSVMVHGTFSSVSSGGRCTSVITGGTCLDPAISREMLVGTSASANMGEFGGLSVCRKPTGDIYIYIH